MCVVIYSFYRIYSFYFLLVLSYFSPSFSYILFVTTCFENFSFLYMRQRGNRRKNNE